MAEVQPQPAAAEGQGQEQTPMWQRMLNLITMYFLVSFVASTLFGPGSNKDDTKGTSVGSPAATSVSKGGPVGTVRPLWPRDAPISFDIAFTAYFPPAVASISGTEASSELNSTLLALTEDELRDQGLTVPTYETKLLANTTLTDLYFSDADPEQSVHVDIDVLECMTRNCTIVAEINFETIDAIAVPSDFHRSQKYRTVMTGWFDHKVVQEKNLFDDENDDDVPSVVDHQDDDERTMAEVSSGEEKDSDRIVHYLRPTLVLNPVADWTKHTFSSLPDPIKKHFRFAPLPSAGKLKKEKARRDFNEDSDEEIVEDQSETEEEQEEVTPGLSDSYFPLLYINNFWSLKEHLREMNTSTVRKDNSTFNVTVNYYPLSIFKFMIYTQMEASFDSQEAYGTMRKGERDNTKKIFVETNPILLGVTFLVSILHLVFEYLAFSNDVKFWRGKKNFKGLSLRSLMMNCYFQIVIFLYLLDSDQTSWTVLLPTGIGVFIEFWKIRKVVILKPKTEEEKAKAAEAGGLLSKFPFHIEFVKTYRGKTKKYDEIALKWLFIAGAPCLAAYTIYSALNHNYKGWYSFAIKTQVRFIYFSGFVMMCPQIFINYKMKCVAHMPWRTFTYKALNTVIDDLFAFIITMPTMHRLACFRDDVVFLILLYQRWIYPVNMKLTEDGDLPETDDEEEQEVATEIEDAAKAITGEEAGDAPKDLEEEEKKKQ